MVTPKSITVLHHNGVVKIYKKELGAFMSKDFCFGSIKLWMFIKKIPNIQGIIKISSIISLKMQHILKYFCSKEPNKNFSALINTYSANQNTHLFRKI